MSLGSVVAFLIVLLLIFIAGNLWFHFVESILKHIKNRFAGRREPPAWHPLSQEDQEER